VSDLRTSSGGRGATRQPSIHDDGGPATGRHAFDEDAVLTPIFHALTRGGWRSRQHEPAARAVHTPMPADPVDAFRRDPLTAPIPIQALVPAPSPAPPSRRGAAHAVPESRPETVDIGRHHHRRERVRSHAGW
jgi:hypothetical protein